MWFYNTSHHTTIDLTPFEVVYGYAPSSTVPFEAANLEVEFQLQTRDEPLQYLKGHIYLKEWEFRKNDWLWMKFFPEGRELYLDKLFPNYYYDTRTI